MSEKCKKNRQVPTCAPRDVRSHPYRAMIAAKQLQMEDTGLITAMLINRRPKKAQGRVFNPLIPLIPLIPGCKATFSHILYIILCYFKFLRPEHDCYAKFTSCST